MTESSSQGQSVSGSAREAGSLLSRLPDWACVERLWSVLPEARLVGGCVRDLLCSRRVNDIDLATPEPPDHVQRLLEGARIRVVPTGLSHGTVTAVIDRTPYEITTLRRDRETNGRHARVEWTADWSEDAARRDFTINALSLDRQGRLHDYFNGQGDLAAGRVRFVGNAGLRIEEDALRILRFFRFQARYGGDIPDRDAVDAITARAPMVATLSPERVASELLRILAGPNVCEIVALMVGTGVVAHCGPNADFDDGQRILRRLIATGAPAGALLRACALYGLQSGDLAQALKLSRADRQHLLDLSETYPPLGPTMSEDDVRRARFHQPLAILLERSWLVQAQDTPAPPADWEALRQRLSAATQPVFPLSGRIAAQMGVESGPEMGAWLRKGQAWWLEQGCRPDRAACIAYLQAHT